MPRGEERRFPLGGVLGREQVAKASLRDAVGVRTERAQGHRRGRLLGGVGVIQQAAKHGRDARRTAIPNQQRGLSGERVVPFDGRGELIVRDDGGRVARRGEHLLPHKR